MGDTRYSQPTDPSASSDDEIVAALQRLAHAQAQLFQAENDVSSPSEEVARLGERNREIEEAHTKLLWTQAETLTAPRGARTPKALEPARKAEQQALAKFGFASFNDYLDDRARRPTNNKNLAVARHDYREANDNWDAVLRRKSGSDPSFDASPSLVTAHSDRPSPPPFSAAASSSLSSAGYDERRSEGLTPSMRIGIAAAAILIVFLAGFVVLKSRGTSSADEALATAPLRPVPSTTARPITSISTKPATGPSVTTNPLGSPVTTVKVGSPAPTTGAVPTTAPAAPATTASTGHTAALCASAKIFSLDDLVGLATRAVANPKAMLQAYESMALTAPANLTPQMQALGPLTRQAIGEIQKGTITTPEGLQQWLAAAPKPDLEQWIAAQLIVVPAVKDLCAAP